MFLQEKIELSECTAKDYEEECDSDEEFDQDRIVCYKDHDNIIFSNLLKSQLKS